MRHALEGIRVLDITQVMAGPYCAMLLCDMGADVIKVEPPAGDSSRRMAGGSGSDSPAFNAVNRGKRGIVINLKSTSGRNTLKRLASKSDILIENYRPGVMGKLGLNYEEIRKINPRLIYASISGYGQTGPSRDKGGFDLIAQGVSGLMSVTGEFGDRPVKIGVPLTDLGAGLFAVSGILAALFHRERSDRGQHIDTSLVDAGIALSVWEATEFFSSGVSPRPLGSAHRMSAPYQAIKCSDGFITLGAANDRLFKRLCAVLGHPEWAQELRFSSDSRRVEQKENLAEKIQSVTGGKSRAYWLSLLESEDIPCGPINDYAEVFKDPQVLSRELVVKTNHPTLGQISTLGTPLKLSETPLKPGQPGPLLGQHTDEILSGIGFTREEIITLRTSGAIG